MSSGAPSARRARVLRCACTVSLLALIVGPLAPPVHAQDWANLAQFRAANAKLPAPVPNQPRVVFMGNSITESWAPLFPTQFPGKPYIGRGISGQTTPQMVLRFHQDVIASSPPSSSSWAGLTTSPAIRGHQPSR